MSTQPILFSVALAATLVWILVATSQYGVRDVWRFGKFAPHQGFFMLVAFPLCAIFVGKSISLATSELPKLLKPSWASAVLEHYWPIVLFGSIGIAGLAAAFEAVQQGRSLDKLHPVFAEQAITLISKLENEQRVAISDNAKSQIEAKKVKASEAFVAFAAAPSVDSLGKLPDRAQLRALLDRDTQFVLKTASPQVLFASQTQVFLGVFLFIWLLFSCGVVAWLQYSTQLDVGAKEVVSSVYRHAILALALLLIQPITYSAYRERIDAIVYPELPLGGSFFIAALGIACIAAITLLDPAKENAPYWYFTRAAPLAPIAAFLIASKVKEGALVHKLIGWDASPGSFCFVVVLMWVVFGLLAVLPRYHT